MYRHAVASLAVVALLGLAPGCKGMGGVLSGLGKVAAGAAKASAAVAAPIAKGVAKAGPAIARGVAHTAPTVLRASEAALETAAVVLPPPVPEFDLDLPIQTLPPREIDPCQTCPIDVECGVCAGFAGYASVVSPAGALARCESSAPPDAPQAPES
jgi:hypothetical protein